MKGAFDETSFNFTLVHGSGDGTYLHTDVMIASATFKAGENAGMPVPLHCTWYNSDDLKGNFI